MSISGVLVCFLTIPVFVLTATLMVWVASKILDFDLKTEDKVVLVGITTFVEASVTLILLCAAYGKS